MKRFIIYLPILLLIWGSLNSCKKDKDVKDEVTLSLSGLKNIGSDFVYEGWIHIGDKAVSTGQFTIDDKGLMSKSKFKVNIDSLQKATKFSVSIEPKDDKDKKPSKTVILGGEFKDNTASLSIKHSLALKTDFTSATGKYILATPTDGDNTKDEESGIWWLDNSSGTEKASLTLPTLPSGWKYEGWVVADETYLSTGTFDKATDKDQEAPYSKSTAGPSFPGEDFLDKAPRDVTFPLSLKGKKTFISVEPDPDNSNNPYIIQPLTAEIPKDAQAKTLYNMKNNAGEIKITGEAKR